MTRRLEGRIAAVLGGASGMGRAISHRLAAEGAHVWIGDLNDEAAKQVAEEIYELDGLATPHRVDATSIDDLIDFFAHIDAEHGRLHILHDQVGIPGPAALDVSEDEWQRTIDVNVKSAFFATKHAYELLKRSEGKGSITYTASSSALVGSLTSPIYSLSKGAIVAFTRSVALQGAPDGIRANVICPGPVDTPMLPQFLGRRAGADLSDVMTSLIASVPLGRPATVDEIAGVVAFLASDDAGFVTGATIPIDGGQTAR